MDTITQITLGAAVGEAVLGRKVGYRAALTGAVLGVVPDLDILANPFLDEVGEIAAHRGITHSLFFCAAASPIFGWVINRIRSKYEIGWKGWSRLSFWVLLTHIFIDACTSYGTQIFQPFSNYAVSFNSIFIIDPFYSVPLFLGITCALFFKRSDRKRLLANYLGLGISSAYLFMGFAIKMHVNSVFEEQFEKEEISVARYMTTPAPFSVFLWAGYAETGDTIHAGVYSIFDEDRSIELIPIKKNSESIKPYEDQLPVERLVWFSNGYYAVRERDSGMYFYDLRFGRSDLWLTDNADTPFIWSYKLQFNNDSTKVIGFRHFEPSFNAGDGLFEKLLGRTFGVE